MEAANCEKDGGGGATKTSEPQPRAAFRRTNSARVRELVERRPPRHTAPRFRLHIARLYSTCNLITKRRRIFAEPNPLLLRLAMREKLENARNNRYFVYYSKAKNDVI